MADSPRYLCPDCGQPLATHPDSLCVCCQQFRDRKFAEMSEEFEAQQARRARMRMPAGQRFAEALADLAKVAR